MTADEAMTALYAVPLGEFVAKRDALAKELKLAGETDASKQIAAQHKPTQAAWTLNALSREHAEEVSALIAAGKGAAKAQQSGEGVREAIAEQRAAAAVVNQKLAKLVASLGLSPGLVTEISPLLQAVSVDPELAAQLQVGQFSKLPEANIGFFGLGALPSAPSGAAAPAPVAKAEGKVLHLAKHLDAAREKEAAAKKLKEAREAAMAARQVFDAAQKEVALREKASADAADGVEKARELLHAAEALAKSAREAIHDAKDEAKKAQRAVERTESMLKELER